MRNLLLKTLARWAPLLSFRGSQHYWQERYRLGGDSGTGSTGAAAIYKALVLNAFVTDHPIQSVIEFGCGDGQQLALASYPDYLGVDVSEDAILMCRRRFLDDRNKQFKTLAEYGNERADLALSLDVIFHLVEDDVYHDYMKRLFDSAKRFVVIYSTDDVGGSRSLRHVRDRHVSDDVKFRFPEFERMAVELLPPVESNRGMATQFFFYCRKGA